MTDSTERPDKAEHDRKMRQRYLANWITLQGFRREYAHAFSGTGPTCKQCHEAPDSSLHMCPECEHALPLEDGDRCPACGRRAPD